MKQRKQNKPDIEVLCRICDWPELAKALHGKWDFIVPIATIPKQNAKAATKPEQSKSE